MFKEKVEKVIEDIQSKNKDLKVFPSLLEVCDPGESGFVPRSTGDSGYILLSPFEIKAKEHIIKGTKPVLLDYMGVSPFIMVVMESGSKSFKPGQIVQLKKDAIENFDEIIVNCAIALYVPDSIILGIDTRLTEKVNNTKIIKTIADA